MEKVRATTKISQRILCIDVRVANMLSIGLTANTTQLISFGFMWLAEAPTLRLRALQGYQGQIPQCFLKKPILVEEKLLLAYSVQNLSCRVKIKVQLQKY